jgi:predicted DNA-binding transcriptional regulator AlpA
VARFIYRRDLAHLQGPTANREDPEKMPTTKEQRDALNAQRGAANDSYYRGGSPRGPGRIFTYETLPEKGISYSSNHIRRLVRKRKFPAPFYMSERRPAWTEAALDEWIAGLQRKEAADAQ